MLEDEAKRDAKKYNAWYKDFNQFIKEGITTDVENKDQLLRLMRFNGSWTGEDVNLDQYVAKMNEGQDKIYYAVVSEKQTIESSPFYEPFKGSGVPVLVL